MKLGVGLGLIRVFSQPVSNVGSPMKAVPYIVLRPRLIAKRLRNKSSPIVVIGRAETNSNPLGCGT